MRLTLSAAYSRTIQPNVLARYRSPENFFTRDAEKQEEEMIATTMQTISTNTFNAQDRNAQLVADAQRGNLDAFNALVVEYQDAVYRQALWLLGEPEAAQDAAQESFIRAYQKIHTFHGGPFRPWIIKIVSNYCIDLLRREKARPSCPLDLYDEYNDEIETPYWIKDPGMPVEEQLEHREQAAVIRRCLERLSPEYRSAVILVDVQEMDYVEAAAVMGVSLGTFKSRLFRARLQVQKQLKKFAWAV
jgi:RNA polymerase sigma-70 factor (ECF subfamily)